MSPNTCWVFISDCLEWLSVCFAHLRLLGHDKNKAMKDHMERLFHSKIPCVQNIHRIGGDLDK